MSFVDRSRIGCILRFRQVGLFVNLNKEGVEMGTRKKARKRVAFPTGSGNLRRFEIFAAFYGFTVIGLQIKAPVEVDQLLSKPVPPKLRGVPLCICRDNDGGRDQHVVIDEGGWKLQPCSL